MSLWWQETDDEDDSVKPDYDSAISSPKVQTTTPANFILSVSFAIMSITISFDYLLNKCRIPMKSGLIYDRAINFQGID